VVFTVLCPLQDYALVRVSRGLSTDYNPGLINIISKKLTSVNMRITLPFYEGGLLFNKKV